MSLILKKLNFKKIVYLSSHKIYGNVNSINVDENCKFVKTSDNYGLIKRKCEKLLKNFSSINNNISILTLRFCGFVEDKSFISDTIHKLKKDQTIEIYNNGKIVRDYLFIKNSNFILNSSINFNKKGFNIFNIGSGEILNNLEIITYLKRKLKSKSKIHTSKKLNKIGNFNFNITKAKRELGYKPIDFKIELNNHLENLK